MKKIMEISLRNHAISDQNKNETTGNKSVSVTGYAQSDSERIKELEEWIVDCRDKILYPLAHEDSELGKLAEG